MPAAAVANQVMSAANVIGRIPSSAGNCSRTFLPHSAAERHTALDPYEGGVPDPPLITDETARQFTPPGRAR